MRGDVGSISLVFLILSLGIVLLQPIKSQVETIYLQPLPQQSEYYIVNDAGLVKFTYFDGEVKQTLKGDYEFKEHYVEGLEKVYMEVSYEVTFIDKYIYTEKSLANKNITSLDVYLEK